MRNKLFPNMQRLTTVFSGAILLIFVVVLALRLTAFSDKAEKPATTDPTPSENLVTTEDGTPLYLIADQLYFPTAEETIQVKVLENSDANTDELRLNITRNDNSRSIFVSGNLAPGGTLGSIKLQGNQLPEGKYECTATLTFYDSSNQKKETYQEPILIYVGIKPES